MVSYRRGSVRTGERKNVNTMITLMRGGGRGECEDTHVLRRTFRMPLPIDSHGTVYDRTVRFYHSDCGLILVDLQLLEVFFGFWVRSHDNAKFEAERSCSVWVV